MDLDFSPGRVAPHLYVDAARVAPDEPARNSVVVRIESVRSSQVSPGLNVPQAKGQIQGAATRIGQPPDGRAKIA
jgi:hypothetical protein